MIEDKRQCPNCGHLLHQHRYLMSVDPDASWPWWWKPAALLLGFLFAWGLFLLIGV